MDVSVAGQAPKAPEMAPDEAVLDDMIGEEVMQEAQESDGYGFLGDSVNDELTLDDAPTAAIMMEPARLSSMRKPPIRTVLVRRHLKQMTPAILTSMIPVMALVRLPLKRVLRPTRPPTVQTVLVM